MSTAHPAPSSATRRRPASRPPVLIESGPPRVWMERLEPRVLLSGPGDVPPGYFRMWGSGATTADAGGTAAAIDAPLDVGVGPFTGTLATFYGHMPKVDRAYVRAGGDWMDVALADVPGPTFEARVSDVDFGVTLLTTSAFAWINDHGPDAAPSGPTLIGGPGTLVPLAPETTLRVYDPTGELLQVPGVLDRAARAGDRYQVGLDFRDGRGVAWQDATPRAAAVAGGPTTFVPLVIGRDLRGVTDLDVTVRRTRVDGSGAAAVTQHVTVDASAIVPRDPARPFTPPPAAVFPWYVACQDDAPLRPIDRAIDSLCTFSTGMAFPAGTVATIDWPDGTIETSMPISTGDGVDGRRWTYRLDVRPRMLTAGENTAHVTFRHDGHDADAYWEAIGMDGTMIPAGVDARSAWSAYAKEGDGRGTFLRSFYDAPGVPLDAYAASVTLDDGTRVPARVEVPAGSSEDGGVYAIVADLTLWSPTGRPVVHYEDVFTRRGTVNVTRPGDAFEVPVEISVYESDWRRPAGTDDLGTHAPPMIKLKAAKSPAVFVDRRGRLEVEVRTAYDVPAESLAVTVRWDANHAAVVPAERVGPGRYVVRAGHAYRATGRERVRVEVTHGDATRVVEREVYSVDRASDGVLVLSNPVVDNAYAGIDWGATDVWFGSVAFVDAHSSDRPEGEPAAEIAFDDGSPARAMVDGNYRDDDVVGGRVFFQARLRSPGEQAFTVTIRTADGRSAQVRGVARVMPREAYAGWLRGSGGGLILTGENGEPLADAPTAVVGPEEPEKTEQPETTGDATGGKGVAEARSPVAFPAAVFATRPIAARSAAFDVAGARDVLGRDADHDDAWRRKSSRVRT